MSKLYNHAYDIAFSLENDSPTGEATADELRSAIIKRVTGLSDIELMESCSLFDTYEIDE
jgi:hypothetical protein